MDAALDKEKVMIATQCFKRSFAMRTKPMNTEAVNFFQSAFSVEALNFTTRSCSLKKDMTGFSKPRILFCRGVNVLVCESRSQREKDQWT